jgi:hypothetical protein
MNLIIILVVLLLLFGGGGYYMGLGLATTVVVGLASCFLSSFSFCFSGGDGQLFKATVGVLR